MTELSRSKIRRNGPASARSGDAPLGQLSGAPLPEVVLSSTHTAMRASVLPSPNSVTSLVIPNEFCLLLFVLTMIINRFKGLTQQSRGRLNEALIYIFRFTGPRKHGGGGGGIPTGDSCSQSPHFCTLSRSSDLRFFSERALPGDWAREAGGSSSRPAVPALRARATAPYWGLLPFVPESSQALP